MKKIIVITGLTATGKSELALEIAKQYNGEIISADSVQVYKDLNIGSAKVDKNALKKIPHYLINIKNCTESYNVGEFLQDCQNAIQEIERKEKLPIIVGGTGLYIKALLEGFSLGNTGEHNEFRKIYQKMAKEQGNLAVWNELNKINPTKAKTVHFNNLKRVIRYLEIETFGEEISKEDSIIKDYQICAVGVVCDRQKIYSKIDTRVDKMIELGLENEVRELLKNGITRESQAVSSIGYKEWFDYFENKVDYATTINLIKQHSRNYCKRQLTFLKTIKNLELMELAEARKKIEDFFNDKV